MNNESVCRVSADELVYNGVSEPTVDRYHEAMADPCMALEHLYSGDKYDSHLKELALELMAATINGTVEKVAESYRQHYANEYSEMDVSE